MSANRSFLTVIGAAALICGCGVHDHSVAGGPASSVFDDPAWPEIGLPDADQLDEPIHANTDTRCQDSCAAQWTAEFEACAAHPDSNMDGIDCEARATDRIAICVEVLCATHRQVQSQCAANCAHEARIASRDCVAEHGFDASCLEEGDDVFQTCFGAECVDSPAPVGEEPTVGPPVDIDVEGSGAPAKAPTCREMCQALDQKTYLQCIAEEENVDRCREDMGEVYDACVAAHCAPE